MEAFKQAKAVIKGIVDGTVRMPLYVLEEPS